MIVQAEGDSDVMIDMACKQVVMKFRGPRISKAYVYVMCDKSKKIDYVKKNKTMNVLKELC